MKKNSIENAYPDVRRLLLATAALTHRSLHQPI